MPRSCSRLGIEATGGADRLPTGHACHSSALALSHSVGLTPVLLLSSDQAVLQIGEPLPMLPLCSRCLPTLLSRNVTSLRSSYDHFVIAYRHLAVSQPSFLRPPFPVYPKPPPSLYCSLPGVLPQDALILRLSFASSSTTTTTTSHRPNNHLLLRLFLVIINNPFTWWFPQFLPVSAESSKLTCAQNALT